jgi:hypothetical protein
MLGKYPCPLSVRHLTRVNAPRRIISDGTSRRRPSPIGGIYASQERIMRNYKKKRNSLKKCAMCGEYFWPHREDQVYCKSRCRTRAARLMPISAAPLAQAALRGCWEAIKSDMVEMVDLMAFQDLCIEFTAPAWIERYAASMLTGYAVGGVGQLHMMTDTRLDVARRIEVWLSR